MKSCPSTIAIFRTVTLTSGKDLQNDLQWLIKVLAKTICQNIELALQTPLPMKKTKPSQLPLEKDFVSHWTLDCLKVECLFTKWDTPEYELTFNDRSKVIKSTDVATSYMSKISV